ncbi:MAG: hypothetical protein AABY07_04515, partial [Nanoarchaeota archaeon]
SGPIVGPYPLNPEIVYIFYVNGGSYTSIWPNLKYAVFDVSSNQVSPPQQLDTSVYYLDMKIDNNKDRHLVYVKSLPSPITPTHIIKYQKNPPYGAVELVPLPFNSFILGVAIAVDNNNRPYVVYVKNESLYDRIYLTKKISGIWTIPQLVYTTPINTNIALGAEGIDIDIDLNNDIHISFIEYINLLSSFILNHLVVMPSGAINLNIVDQVFTAGSYLLSSPNIDLNDAGVPYFTYRKYTMAGGVGNIFYSYLLGTPNLVASGFFSDIHTISSGSSTMIMIPVTSYGLNQINLLVSGDNGNSWNQVPIDSGVNIGEPAINKYSLSPGLVYFYIGYSKSGGGLYLAYNAGTGIQIRQIDPNGGFNIRLEGEFG